MTMTASFMSYINGRDYSRRRDLTQSLSIVERVVQQHFVILDGRRTGDADESTLEGKAMVFRVRAARWKSTRLGRS
jgi:hypothetical protein